jgi:hypothetical protein
MKAKLLESFGNLVNSIISAAPKVLIGILLLIAGLALAKLVEVLLRLILVRVRFDSLVEKAGVDKALQRIGLRQQLNIFIPRLVYFMVIFLIVKAASDALGLIAISSAIGAFFEYLPNIIAALLLLILGSTVGQFARQMVTQSAESSGLDFAGALGKLVSGLIMFVVAMMAIAQLKIDTEMVRIVTSFILGGAAIAFGLSFGLGTRDTIRNIVAAFYARKFLKVGKNLEVAGQRGVLSAITATHTILTNEGQDINVSNSTFLDQVSKQ